MGKRGTKPKGKIKIKWSSKFAYAIGLLSTDGCLYNDNRHLSLTTKDIEQAENFKKCLGLKVKIGLKSSGSTKEKKYFHVQFGDVLFYSFLQSIGLTSKKSLTMGKIKIPKELFFDFLRGCFDGDGCSYSYWDPRWRSSYMFYISFASGSYKFITWIRKEVSNRLKIKSHIGISKNKPNVFYQLKYSKYAAIELAKAMYEGSDKYYLNRKKLKINKCLGIIGQADM